MTFFAQWDTAGQERFRTITTSYYRGAHAIMARANTASRRLRSLRPHTSEAPLLRFRRGQVVYNVTERPTFENVPKWVREARKFRGDDAVIILVGNMTDIDSERQVSTEEGRELAESLGVADGCFHEASAKKGVGVEEAFRSVTTSLLLDVRRKPRPLYSPRVPPALPPSCLLFGLTKRAPRLKQSRSHRAAPRVSPPAESR